MEVLTVADILHGDCRPLPVGEDAKCAFTVYRRVPSELRADIDPATPLVLCRQTHSLCVAEVHTADEFPEEVDALITRTPGLAIGIRTADCVPVMVSAPDRGYVAAIHAGWRGTLGRIVRHTIARLCALGCDPAQMHAAIGPCICRDCYEVDDDLGSRFIDEGFGPYVAVPADSPTGKPHLDLPGINRRILTECGLPADHIHSCAICTRETPLLPSYRRSPGTSDRLVTFIISAPNQSPK